MHAELSQAAARITDFMRRAREPAPSDAEFNTLAVELWRVQRELNRAYGKICAARDTKEVTTWQQIPSVPTAAFKELEFTSLTESERTNVFFSSGTTQQNRSRHFHSRESLALYKDSVWLWFEKSFAREKEGVNWLFLTPDMQQAPNSSLVYMFQTIAARAPADRVDFVGGFDRDGYWAINVPRLLNILFLTEGSKKPVAIFGTAFLFVELLTILERGEAKVQLPERSWIFETGGYKGRTREVPKEELHRSISDRLGISSENIFGEYGMSELSSQAYAGADGLFRFPPWARVQMISPATGREAREGERGLIRVYDLANVWSVMAVQTEDVGVREGDRFRLLGRAAEAEARGCSLMSV